MIVIQDGVLCLVSGVLFCNAYFQIGVLFIKPGIVYVIFYIAPFQRCHHFFFLNHFLNVFVTLCQ